MFNSSTPTATPAAPALDPGRLPRHVGVIMDGNGRWARARYLPRLAGHRAGVERVRELITYCAEIHLRALTLYAFSDENWSRPAEEVTGLMGLLKRFLRAEVDQMVTNGVRFRAIGDRTRLSEDLRALINETEALTAAGAGLQLTVALSYGGQAEILRATRALAERVKAGMEPAEIDAASFEAALDTRDLPPLDLVVRTSGEQRVSNFLLWQIAYAEIRFVPEPWPEFTTARFEEVLRSFAGAERRFGLVSEQVQIRA
jgi:undecaprenyl diphosphate synthase